MNKRQIVVVVLLVILPWILRTLADAVVVQNLP